MTTAEPTLTVTRPPHIDPRRWYDPRLSWHARQQASDAERRNNRPADVTYENHRRELPEPANECPVCGQKFGLWKGVVSHHVRAHGGGLDVCSQGHDLTAPKGRLTGGGCRICRNEARRVGSPQ